MGLLKAGLGAAGGVMADQWKEFIYYIVGKVDLVAEILLEELVLSIMVHGRYLIMMVLVIFMIPTKITHLPGIILVLENKPVKQLVTNMVVAVAVAASGEVGLVLIIILLVVAVQVM